MKTVYRVLAAAAIAAVSAGCAKEEIEGQSQMPQAKVEMAFTSEAASTRTQLVDGSKVIWTEGDAIGIFGGAEAVERFALQEIDVKDASKAVFTGSAVPAETYYAIYPYYAGAKMAGGVISTVLPSEQEAVSGTFGADVNLSAAVSTAENSLSFRNVCGLVSLEISSIPEGYTLQAISIEGQNGEKIAGDVNISVPKLTATAAETAGTSVTVKAAESAGLAAGTYVFTILPADFTKGLKFTFDYGDAGKSELVSNQAVTVAAGENHQLPAVAAKAPEGTAGNPYKISDAGELLAFASAAGEYAAEDVVVLTADIDMDGKTWTPFVLGCTLDGQGHKIYNVTAGQGTLISQVTGTLKNVVFGSEDGQNYDGKSVITMVGNGNNGGLVMENHGTIETVVNFVKIDAETSGTPEKEVRIGGIAGSNYSDIISCENRGEMEVTGTSSSMIYVAGITGWASDADVTISESANYGTITVDNEKVQGIAGIAGMNRGQNIVDCDNYGEIIVKNSAAQNSWVGGIMGYCQNQTQTEKKLSGCENHGTFDIQAPSVAGVAGIAGCIHMWSYAPVTIENCKNESGISVTTANGWMHLGGILSNVALPGSNVGDFTNKITGCTNNGGITLGAPAGAGLSGQARIGGIAGSASKKITIENSANTGAVTSTKLTTCYAGGILGWTDCEELVLTGNDNSGSVKLSPDKSVATQCYAGGILGSSACGNAVLTDNENSAAEVSIDCDSQSSKPNLLSSVGGITGLSDDDANTMTGNINRASVLSSTRNDVWVPGGGIIGGVKGSVDMSLNINFGDVTVTSAGTAGDTFCGGLVGFFNMGDTSGSAQSPVTESAELVGDKTFGKLTSTGLCGLIGNSAWGSYGSSITVTDCVVGGTISGSNVSGAGNEVTLGPDSTIAAWLFGYKDNNSTKYTESGTSYGEASGYEN